MPRITSTNFTECIQVETTDWILQCNNSSVFLLDIDSFIKEGNFGSKTMPLLKQRTCFLENKLHRKSYYQCDGISAIWRGLYWCFIFPLGGFSYRKELTLSWLQSTPLSMFLENNNFFLTKDLNVCSFFFKTKQTHFIRRTGVSSTAFV